MEESVIGEAGWKRFEGDKEGRGGSSGCRKSRKQPNLFILDKSRRWGLKVSYVLLSALSVPDTRK